MSEQQSAVERLAEQWNTTPDHTPSTYDLGRVDQRHEMTRQLLEAIEADRRAGWETDRLLDFPSMAVIATRRVTPWVPVKQEGTDDV
ncbi:hypothetical protein [Microbacterium sp. MMO-113]|uniref:hypothetical protein n=1 Tax=Microbacterium sp. MMO-113 TaxID=3081273 RepID=UPI00301A2391